MGTAWLSPARAYCSFLPPVTFILDTRWSGRDPVLKGVQGQEGCLTINEKKEARTFWRKHTLLMWKTVKGKAFIRGCGPRALGKNEPAAYANSARAGGAQETQQGRPSAWDNAEGWEWHEKGQRTTSQARACPSCSNFISNKWYKTYFEGLMHSSEAVPSCVVK